MVMETQNRPTLVLNKSWIPINTITVREAIARCCTDWLDERKISQPKAKILDIDTWRTYSWDDWKDLIPNENDTVIASTKGKHRVPEIIIAGRYNRIPKNQLNFNRKNIFRRDGNICQFCGKWFPNNELSFDHVIPRCQGGEASWENIVLSCYKCNQHKGGRTPEQAGMKLIREPVKPGLEILNTGNHKIRSWEIFFGKKVPSKNNISELYWEVPLQ